MISGLRGMLPAAALLFPVAAAAQLSVSSWQAGPPALTLEWGGAGADTTAVSGVLAVPPGCVRVVAHILEGPASSPLPEFGKPARFRDAALASFQWRPPRGARLRLALSFETAAPPPKAFAGNPGEPSERLLASWIVNYAQSRHFRSRTAAATAKAAAVTPLPAIRLSVFTTRDGIAVISRENLAAAGVPLAGMDPRRLQLFRGETEIPLYVHGEEDGRLDPGDYLEFIGSRAMGRNTYLSPYTPEAAFYLVWGQRPGLRAPAVPVAPKPGSPDPAPPHFVSAHIEEDREILRVGSRAPEDITDLGSQVAGESLSDFWFWRRHGTERDAADVPFDLPHTPASGTLTPLPQRPVLRVHLKGITNDVKADPDHHLRFLLNGIDVSTENGVARHALWEGQNSYTWSSPPLPENALKPGRNVLTLVRVNDLRNSDGKLVENQDAYLNWLEVDFQASYRAVDDALRFSHVPSPPGRRFFRLEGFSSPQISLWDHRGRKLVGFASGSEGDGYRVEFEDSLTAPAQYLAFAPKTREVPQLRLDTLPDWKSPSAGADLLIVTHRSLYGTGLDSLVAARRAQGLRVQVADVAHIYQAFGDGATDPEAIRRFAAWAYENWPRPAPTYLLLIGEASTRFDKGASIRPNQVPTHLVNIRGWGVAASDDAFARVAGDDAVADLLVGRLPVSTPAELSRVVHKILAQEKRAPGAWSNKAYILGGYEAGFTASQYRLQALAAAGDRPPARLDLFPASPYFRPPAGRRDFYRQLDSGFAFVGFFGHGGGSVWSDAGILTLEALDGDSLRGDYPIALVSSITCLTGYFEDPDERSLGEEMLRRPRNGAAGFYGASGYISNAAGELLAAEMLRAASGPGARTLGSVAHQAETQVILKTGENFLPVLAEFNLLGDPSMPYQVLPARTGDLRLTPAVLGSARRLEVSAATTLESGEALISLLMGDSLAATAQANVSGRQLRHTFDLPALPAFTQGKVVAHAWGGARSEVYSAPFSGLDWMIDSLSVEPANPQPGDSARLRFVLRHRQGAQAAAGIALYAVSGDVPGPFPPENQVPLSPAGGGTFVTARRFAVPPPPDPESPTVMNLNVAFRLDLRDSAGNPLPAAASRTFSFPLKPWARLAFLRPPFRLPVQDSLGVWLRYRNDGMGQSGNGRVLLHAHPPDPGSFRDSIRLPRSLRLGQVDSVFLRLPDSALGLTLRAVLAPDNPLETRAGENTRDTAFRLRTALLRGADSLVYPAGPRIRLPSGGAARRVFIGLTPEPALGGTVTPLDTTAAARAAYFIATREPRAEALRLFAPSLSGAAEGAWHFALAPEGPWLRLGGSPAAFHRAGYYGFFRNRDAEPPRVTFQSRGQSLLPDDYVPRGTAVQVLLEDPSGIDLSLRRPRLISASGRLDTAALTVEQAEGFPTLARLQFLPPQEPRDSVTVEAHDAAGNRAVKTLAFRVGERLAIRHLGGYPNPFADTTVFAYTLTDYCEEVVLRVYSRAGRPVRTLRDRRAVGYREVVWDGRTDDGRAVANGLYFLKATAKGSGKEATATFKLFKKRR